MTRVQAGKRATIAAIVTLLLAAWVSYPFLEGVVQGGPSAWALGLFTSALLAPALGACAATRATSTGAAGLRAPIVGALIAAAFPLVQAVFGDGWFLSPLMAALSAAAFTLPTRGLVAATVETRAAPTEDGVDRVLMACGAFLVAVKGPEAILALQLDEMGIAAATGTLAGVGATLVLIGRARRLQRAKRWAKADLAAAPAVADAAVPGARDRAPVLPGDEMVAVLATREGSGTYRSGEAHELVAVVPRSPSALAMRGDLQRAAWSLAGAALLAACAAAVARIGVST